MAESHVDDKSEADYFKIKIIENNNETSSIIKILLKKSIAEVVREVKNIDEIKIVKAELEDKTAVSASLPFEVVKSFG
jgi:hypothetical protein